MPHIRIDEGVRRGPKKTPDPNRTSAGIPRMGVARRRDTQGKVQAIPPDLDPKEVLARYLTEETTSQIAQSYGVSRKSMTAWLRDVAKDDWKRVQIIRAHEMKDKGNDGLEEARDPLSLARAREIVRSAQWELKALDDDYKDPQHQINVSANGPVSVQVVSFGTQSVGNVPLVAETPPHIEGEKAERL